MTAKAYLGQAYKLDKHINSELGQISKLHAVTWHLNDHSNDAAVRHSRNVPSLVDAILQLMEAEEELDHQIDLLVDLKLTLREMIERVPSKSDKMILEKRYLRFMTWDQIANDMHISRCQVLNRHERALDVVDRLLHAKERSVQTAHLLTALYLSQKGGS